MQRKRVITFVGMPGAGKSVCVDHLERKGWPSVYFGGITLDEVKKRGMEINPENEKMVREDLRQKFGPNVYAQRIIEKINHLFEQGNDTVIADGLYSWSEYKEFKQAYGDDAIIIAIAAPRKLRHQRLSKRPVRPLNETEVAKREYAEIENIEKGGPIANADYTIVNDQDTAHLLESLNTLIKSLGK